MGSRASSAKVSCSPRTNGVSLDRSSFRTVTESISVQAENVQVQTSSSENSELLSTRQMDQLASKGRDVVALLGVMPGVTATTDNAALGDTFGTATRNISGTRKDEHLHAGWTDRKRRRPRRPLQWRYQHGCDRRSKGAVQQLSREIGAMPVRSSTSFRSPVPATSTAGVLVQASRAVQHERFLQQPARTAYTVISVQHLWRHDGGPVFIPGKFNKERNKLFFFYSREDWRILSREPLAR